MIELLVSIVQDPNRPLAIAHLPEAARQGG